MAGSYRHLYRSDGTFRGFDLIENLGDAIDAMEELCLMLEWLTKSDKRLVHEAWLEGYFKQRCPKENLHLATYEEFWGNDEEEF